MSHDKLSTHTYIHSLPCHHLELQAWSVQFEVAMDHSKDKLVNDNPWQRNY